MSILFQLQPNSVPINNKWALDDSDVMTNSGQRWLLPSRAHISITCSGLNYPRSQLAWSFRLPLTWTSITVLLSWMMCFLLMTLVLVLILNPLLKNFFLVYQADVSIFYTSNLYWWGKGWPVDGLPFPDTGCPVPDVSIYYMSNINELPDGILFHWFCKCTPPWMFLPLDIPSEYRPEHVTFGLLCVIFKFPSRIFCRRVPGFATDCPCGVWCRGLTTCLLYVGPPLEF